MSEIVVPVVSGLISSLITVGAGYFVAKRFIENAKYELKEEVQDWLNSETGQKAIYSIGALIGNGAKGGFGLSKGSGKFGLNDLIMGIAGKYIQGVIPGMPQDMEQPQQSTESFKTKF